MHGLASRSGSRVNLGRSADEVRRTPQVTTVRRGGMIMLSGRMMGLRPLLALAVLVSACGGERPPSLPPDVIMTGDVNRGIRSTMAKFLVRVRAHDVHGLARLETNPHDSSWA